MTKMLLLLFAAGTVFAAPKFEIYEDAAAIVGCTQENADRYALKTVVIEDEGIEKSMPVNYCLEQNKRGQTYHTIAAECSYGGCTWNGEEVWYDYDKKGRNVHTKSSEGWESWTEYDEFGNTTHYWRDDGYEYWANYDKKGKLEEIILKNGLIFTTDKAFDDYIDKHLNKCYESETGECNFKEWKAKVERVNNKWVLPDSDLDDPEFKRLKRKRLLQKLRQK